MERGSRHEAVALSYDDLGNSLATDTRGEWEIYQKLPLLDGETIFVQGVRDTRRNVTQFKGCWMTCEQVT